MSLFDLLRFSLENLRRTKLRTLLTTLGVIIGIGALVSMVSFGAGLQRNVTETFAANDLFTTLRVFPVKMKIEEALSGNLAGAMDGMQQKTRALDDSALALIAAMPEVAIVFPENTFPVRVRFLGRETNTTLRCLPAAMGAYKPYDKMGWGAFFTSDSAHEVILSYYTLGQLHLSLDPAEKDSAETRRTHRHIPVDSLIGAEIEVITSVFDLGQALGLSSNGQAPFSERVTRLRIAGIRPKPHAFSSPQTEGGILAPMVTGKKIPRFVFTSMWNMLSRRNQATEGYDVLYVRLKKLSDLGPVRKRLQALNFSVFALADQFDEIRRGFLMIDMALGAVGAIALIVASLGIINTMVMSILERTREIGVMKAVGASGRQIQSIFFFEAGVIGGLGGCLGVALGWLVSRLANWIANIWMARQGGAGAEIDFFYLPIWLIVGALLFSLLVSLLAGWYPAARASRINPVEALRHD